MPPHQGLPLSAPPAPARRVARLDSRVLVGMVAAAVLLIFGLGAWRAPNRYGTAAYVIDYFGTEAAGALFMLALTVLLLPPRHIGLRPPQWVSTRRVLPLLLLSAVVTVAWIGARASLPPAAVFDHDASWRVLRTTLLVGLNEEWIFRGLLLAALCRWWGLRRGALAALLAFGAFHLLNAMAGVPLPLALLQMVMATIAGSIFLLAALGTRSLWLPMGVHGLYDFAVIDIAAMSQVGAAPWPGLALAMAGPLVGVWCLFQVARLRASGEPYGP